MMDLKSPSIDISEIIEEIRGIVKKEKVREIMIQAPEGLRKEVQVIVKRLKKEGVNTVIHGDPTYGACDLPLWQAKLLGIKHLIHLGHTKFHNTEGREKVKIHYIPIHKKVSDEWIEKGINTVVKELNKNHIRKVGLVSTVQYTHILSNVKEKLKKADIKGILHKSHLQEFSGQILGCEVTAAKELEEKVDGILYIGEGEFHAIGLVKEIEKPIVKWNIDSGKVSTIPKKIRDEIIRRDIIRLSKLKDAKNIIMVIPTKIGQYCRFSKGWRSIKEELEKEGKNVYVIEAYHINPTILEGYEYDIIVNLACPRLEDDKIFPKPIISLSTLSKYKRLVE